jgi:hypothetical protein
MAAEISLELLQREHDKLKAQLESRTVERDRWEDLSKNPPMTDTTDYRNELKLRDEQLRREMDIRQESFRAEQAVRDKALEDRFAGFLTAQVERDKAWEKTSEARFDRIEKDIGGIKSDTKKVADDINGIKVTMAKYLGGAIVIGALASAALGGVIKHILP